MTLRPLEDMEVVASKQMAPRPEPPAPSRLSLAVGGGGGLWVHRSSCWGLGGGPFAKLEGRGRGPQGTRSWAFGARPEERPTGGGRDALCTEDPAWAWAGGCTHRACLGGSQHKTGSLPHPANPPRVGRQLGVGSELLWGSPPPPHPHPGDRAAEPAQGGGRGTARTSTQLSHRTAGHTGQEKPDPPLHCGAVTVRSSERALGWSGSAGDGRQGSLTF